MAIDRNIFYYKEWTIESNNWKMRLEIRPAGPAMNGTTPTYKRLERTIVELGTMKINFDDIVVGMMNAPSLTIDMEFDEGLDVNFDELIRNQFYDQGTGPTINGITYNIVTTNLYVLFSDCGSGGDLDKVLYCGAQSNQLGNKFKYNPATGKLVSATIETFDLLKVILDTTPTAWLAEYVLTYDAEYTIADSFQFYDWIRSNTEYKIDSFGATVELWYIKDVFATHLSYLLGWIQGYWTRTWRLFTDGVDVNITGSPLAHLTFYKQTIGTDHESGTSLDSDDLLFIGRVGGEDRLGGMLIKDKGEETLLAYQYLTDMLRNVAEGMFCKLVYKPYLYEHDDNGLILNYYFKWLAVCDDVFGSIDLTSVFGKQREEAEIETGYNSLNIAEAEIPNMVEPNIQAIEYRKSAADGAPTWNYRLVFHNLPTYPASNTYDYKHFTAGDYRIRERRLNLRKILYRDTELANAVEESFDFVKVHERCLVSSGVLFGESNFSTDIPNLNYYNISQNEPLIRGWVVYTQQTNNIAIAINDLVLRMFNNEHQLNISGELDMNSNYMMPYSCGERVIIPVPAMFTDFEQGSMVLETESDFNPGKGTIKCKFITVVSE